MDDDLELNIAVPVTPKTRPSKPSKTASSGKDGGAKRRGDSTKAAPTPATGNQANGKILKSKTSGFQLRDSNLPNTCQRHSAGHDKKWPGTAKLGLKSLKQLNSVNEKLNRVQHRPGKERFKRSAGGGGTDPDDPEELMRAPEPEEEQEDDLRAVMSLMAQREKALRQEEQQAAAARGGKGARVPAAEREGVVEFDDDDGDGGFRKRRRLNGLADGGGGGGSGGAAASVPKPKGRGNYIPGSLVHAVANATAAGAGGANGAAASSGGGSEWLELGLAASLGEDLTTLGFVSPTPIQRAVLPVLMAGRDALVKAQTGSGKTLSYLLPIINNLQAQQPRITRADGTFALMLAPTRELCIQVYDVAAILLRRYHWLVPGLLIGGENRQHEKARLRKGMAVLVASPGRLLDHLESTAAFKTSELRWLVLDEADRLLDLGFEDKLRRITEQLNKRSGRGIGAAAGAAEQQRRKRQRQKQNDQEIERVDENEDDQEEEGMPGGRSGGREEEDGRKQRIQCSEASAGRHDGARSEGGDQSSRRQTVLLSATLHKQLEVLAELSLQEPAVVGFEVRMTGEGLKLRAAGVAGGCGVEDDDPLSRYSLPASLRQSWMEVPAKERLVALAALLRSRVARRRVGGSKVVVFVASCDEVEFLHHLLGDMWEASAGAQLLPPSVRLFKLHGDMPQAERTETFAGFSQEGDGVLLCTDVAARGLDFPNVTTIIQYDVPGAPSEYVHRVGRSARMGAAGEAVLLLMPHEIPYVNLLRSRGVLLEQVQLDKLARWMPAPQPDQVRLVKGKSSNSRDSGGASGGAARQLAQQLHRHVSMAVSHDPHAAKLANNAYRSFVRAYATHSGDVKRVFAVRNLHLGHVAHSFCLIETPTRLGSSASAADRKRRKWEAAATQKEERRRKMKRAAQRVSA
ncbi:hypothetical protein VaNZ11_013855 [Volvox africanus]|uniref:ATP-dependent RNA helicase n=1 Tax=Volvox africanus TaxID=51714 RepID=A0ABQ5SHY6_9CHLO|nr:hypothetical protein VaNZ11_013855 [Volvox africanus]